MKRLKNNLPDLVPFINSDFGDILQNQHQIAYSGWLDAINDVAPTNNSANNGIILKGCEITFTEPATYFPLTYFYNFNYRLKFTEDDLIYIDGQYYSPAKNLIGQEIIITDQPSFYLRGITFSDSGVEFSQNRTRFFRDKNIKQFSVDYRFELVQGKFPNPNERIHYVGFEWGGTSRRVKRLVKHAKARSGDVYMKTNLDYWPSFDTNPNNPYVAFGTFSSATGTQSTGTILKDFDYNGIGRNNFQGFRMHTELSGKFMVGLDSTSPQNPTNGSYLQNNYGRVNNTGGFNGMTLSRTQIPNHDHGGLMGPSTLEELDHSHKLDNLVSYIIPPQGPSVVVNRTTWTDGFIASGQLPNYKSQYDTYTSLMVGIPIKDTLNVPASSPYGYGQSTTFSIPGVGNQITNFNNDFRGNYLAVRSRGEKQHLTSNPSLNLKNTDWSSLRSHTHEVSSVGDGTPHDNRPPYYVVFYYSKI